jgi:hypothetical protein
MRSWRLWTVTAEILRQCVVCQGGWLTVIIHVALSMTTESPLLGLRKIVTAAAGRRGVFG